MGFLLELLETVVDDLTKEERQEREGRRQLWRDAFADPGGDMLANYGLRLTRLSSRALHRALFQEVAADRRVHGIRRRAADAHPLIHL